jgi:hypothetical protein
MHAIYSFGVFDFSSALAAGLATNAVIDILISIALALTLRERVAGFNERTDSLLKKLIMAGLQTGAFSLLFSRLSFLSSSSDADRAF